MDVKPLHALQVHCNMDYTDIYIFYIHLLTNIYLYNGIIISPVVSYVVTTYMHTYLLTHTQIPWYYP